MKKKTVGILLIVTMIIISAAACGKEKTSDDKKESAKTESVKKTDKKSKEDYEPAGVTRKEYQNMTAQDLLDRIEDPENITEEEAIALVSTYAYVDYDEEFEREENTMSGRKSQELEGITLLGNQKTKYPDDYAPEVLETFENKHPENDYFVKFNAPEFTSLCPITGQPDFATIYISYVPGERMVESKSLKLYLYSFRNHGDFHEDCMNIIMKDLIKLMDPKYIEVWGKFTPRGGISIDPYCNYGRPGTKWEDVAWNRLSNHDLYPEKVDNR